MKALEIERKHDEEGRDRGYRALVWDIDEEPPHRKLLIDVLESDDNAYGLAQIASERHQDLRQAKSGSEVAEPDCITVAEAACAMAGVW